MCLRGAVGCVPRAEVSAAASRARAVQATSAFRHCVIGMLAALSIASTHAAAGTNERNPVRTHPAAASEPAEQRILVKLRSSAAAAAHVQALQSRPNQVAN